MIIIEWKYNERLHHEIRRNPTWTHSSACRPYSNNATIAAGFGKTSRPASAAGGEKLPDAFSSLWSFKLMKTNPLKQGVLTEHSAGVGTATRKMVRERAVELAEINGRSASEVSKSDWEEAKRELTGQPNADPKTVVLESTTESERWDPVPGSTGHKVPVTPSEDEDEEGRSDGEKLVEEGIAEAEHDQMLQATRAAAKMDL